MSGQDKLWSLIHEVRKLADKYEEKSDRPAPMMKKDRTRYQQTATNIRAAQRKLEDAFEVARENVGEEGDQ